MADYINNVAAADAYTPALELGPNFDARSCVITVANNPALMQFAIGKLGNWRWTDEREFFSIAQSFRVGNVIGVRFRNANPGAVARILATLSGEDDVQFESGLPFTGTLSANGSITSTGMITGRVAGNGQILAGTGFTVVKGSTGHYTINLTSPFASPPAVFVNVDADGDNNAVAYSITANSFGISCITVGNFTDVGFSFVAMPIT